MKEQERPRKDAAMLALEFVRACGIEDPTKANEISRLIVARVRKALRARSDSDFNATMDQLEAEVRRLAS